MGWIHSAKVFISLKTRSKKARLKNKEKERRKQARFAFDEINKCLRYPVKKITEDELSKIPKAEELPVGFLETCPVGFWFMCRNDTVPGLIVLGQVVTGGEVFSEQWASGLCIPERGINRYRAEII